MRLLGVFCGLTYGIARSIFVRFLIGCVRHPILAALLFIDVGLIYITI